MQSAISVLLWSFAVTTLCLPSLAGAQDAPRHETVTSRKRPDLDPVGLPLGAFRVYPSLSAGLMHNDNVLATPDGELADSAVTLAPRVRLESGWSRHDLSAGLDIDSARYFDLQHEDFDDVRLWGVGHLDISRGQLELAASHARLHEPRTSPNGVQGTDPTEYRRDLLGVAWRYQPSRVFARVTADLEILDYDDTITETGNVSNADRDSDEWRAALRLGYELPSGLDAFLEARSVSTNYDQKVDDNGFERSSDGYDLVAGLGFDLSGTVFGEAYAGYRRREYQDPSFVPTDGPTFGAEMTWLASGLTTVAVLIDRQVDATTVSGASGVLQTNYGLTVDHELLRNLILQLAYRFATEDYDGISRRDDVTLLRAGGQYLLSRRLHLFFGYDREERNVAPADAGQEYKINRFFLRLQGQI